MAELTSQGLDCLICGSPCERAPSCYPCAARCAGFVLSRDWNDLVRFWRVTNAVEFERARTARNRSLQKEPLGVQASVLAGLAVGMLAIGDRDAAVAIAATALTKGPEAHGPFCCSAAAVLFSPKVFEAGAEVALRARLRCDEDGTEVE